MNLSKKSNLILIPFFSLFTNFVHASTDVEYIGMESLQGSSVYFEKVLPGEDINTSKYTLEKLEDGSYLFQIIDDNSGANGNDNITNLMSLGVTTGFANAKKQCTELNLNGQKWHILSKEDMVKMTNEGKGINANILSFFNSTSQSSDDEHWMESDETWKDTSRLINVARIDQEALQEGYINYYNWIEADIFSAATVCVSEN
ncbi:hypothetical protein [Aliivibrio fischeri]|uniref:hypothetical protein n=1 Tax=Aliivibrio fischeri TaxID=668 RepID=UPI00080DB5F0|nr:hypothetical protein [Aliivibrio fischeri]OCH48164.1 hypothetical protein A6E02_08535 [Aliivibrio fischeri]